MRIYDRFGDWFLASSGVELIPEFRFCAPRRWRFDFAHIETKVAIELEGGSFVGGRHTRGKGFASDCEKYNVAAAQGWAVFRLTPAMLEGSNAGTWRDVILCTIRARMLAG